MSSKKGFHIGTGVTSIIMIFVVLCLTTFAILSYSSAKADYKISKEASDYVKSYYQIRNKAVRDVADINEVVCKGYKKNDDKAVIVGDLSKLGYEINENGIVLSYELSKQQKYIVVISIDESNKRVNIDKNYIISEGKEYEGQGIQLFDDFE